MNQIEPYPIWIGHGGEGHDFRHLFDAGIEAVVELAVEEPSFPPRRDMIACRFPLIDGVGNPPHVLGLAVRTVAALIDAQVPLLVCCADGMSRSPAVVAAALAAVHRDPPEECLKRVTRHHPSDVSPGLWSEVCQLAPRGRDA
jgi:protein-tyrosine phosphatase